MPLLRAVARPWPGGLHGSQRAGIMQHMLRAIIFDFDGVIADTEPLHFAAFERVLRDSPLAITREEYFARYVGLSDRVFLERLAADRRATSAGDFAASELSRYYDEKYHVYLELVRQGTTLIAGLREFLGDLPANLPVAICSGARRPEIDLILSQHDLASRFPIIISSEDVHSSKPEPHGYLMTLHRLRAKHLYGNEKSRDVDPVEAMPADSCLAIEDSPQGILAARAAGMRTLAMLPSHIGSDVSAADLRRENFRGLTWDDLCYRFVS